MRTGVKTGLVRALVASAAAQPKGFNYGSTNTDGLHCGYNDFVWFLNETKSLAGVSDFNTALLYTSIQSDTASDSIESFPAAIDTDASMLVGTGASADRDVF